MKLGYRSGLDSEGTLEAQMLALRGADCDLVFEDIGEAPSGPAKTGLSELMGWLKTDDVLVVWRLDRLSRDFREMVEVLAEALMAGARVVALMDDIDTDRVGCEEMAKIVRSLLSHRPRIDAERALALRQKRMDALRAPRWPSITLAMVATAPVEQVVEPHEPQVGQAA